MIDVHPGDLEAPDTVIDAQLEGPLPSLTPHFEGPLSTVVSAAGERLTAYNKYRRRGADHLPTLQRKGISPHTFRHTKAMHLLQAGVSPATIKDILGHAHLKTLEVYVQADLEMKRRALESTPSPVNVGAPIRRHDPDLLQWLEQL